MPEVKAPKKKMKTNIDTDLQNIMSQINLMGESVSMGDLMSKSRDSDIILKRALVAFGLRELGHTLEKIAGKLGYKTHAAVINLLHYKNFKQHDRKIVTYERITQGLKNGGIESKIAYHTEKMIFHKDAIVLLLEQVISTYE